MLMMNLSQWVDISIRERWVLWSLSLPQNAFFGGIPCTWVDRYRAPPQPRLSVCGWHAARVCEALRHWVVREVGQVFSLSNDIESTVTSVECCAPFQQHNGRNIVRFGVEDDQPPADDRRRGDATYSGSSLECGRQMWRAGRHLLRVAEDGTV